MNFDQSSQNEVENLHSIDLTNENFVQEVIEKSKSTPVTMVFFRWVRPKWSRRKTSTSRKVSSGGWTFRMTIPPSIQKTRFWEETSGPGNFRNSETRSIPSSPKASNAGKR